MNSMSRFASACLVCALVSTTSAAAPTHDGADDAPTEARIARIENGLREPVAVQGAPVRTMRLADRMRALHVPGVSVALIDGGRLAWARTWGVADAASGRPLTTASVFQAASISKPVTAVTTLLLAGPPPVHAESVPGSRFAYSGLGYAVLQQYLTDATGRPFDVLARDTVFAPLGMHDTTFAMALEPALANRAARGHALDGTPVPGGWRRYPELAAAGLWSTPSDLARFAIALQAAAQGQRGALLSQTQARALLTPVQNDYGLGFELDHQGPHAVFHHSGSNEGYKALLYAYTHTGQGVVILTNGDYGTTLIDELMRSIAAEYDWADWRQIERVAVPALPALFDRLVGTYAVANHPRHHPPRRPPVRRRPAAGACRGRADTAGR